MIYQIFPDNCSAVLKNMTAEDPDTILYMEGSYGIFIEAQREGRA